MYPHQTESHENLSQLHMKQSTRPYITQSLWRKFIQLKASKIWSKAREPALWVFHDNVSSPFLPWRGRTSSFISNSKHIHFFHNIDWIETAALFRKLEVLLTSQCTWIHSSHNCSCPGFPPEVRDGHIKLQSWFNANHVLSYIMQNLSWQLNQLYISREVQRNLVVANKQHPSVTEESIRKEFLMFSVEKMDHIFKTTVSERNCYSFYLKWL